MAFGWVLSIVKWRRMIDTLGLVVLALVEKNAWMSRWWRKEEGAL